MNETLLDWLKDAHAMETSIVSLLEKQADKAEDRPEIRSKINEHLQVTRNQADRVKGLIEGMGGDVSRAKEAGMKILTNLQGMTSGAAPDAMVKNMISNLAVENFEIASYRSIIAAAERLGKTDVVNTCQDILAQEVEMADWVTDQIPRVTVNHLEQVATPRT